MCIEAICVTRGGTISGVYLENLNSELSHNTVTTMFFSELLFSCVCRSIVSILSHRLLHYTYTYSVDATATPGFDNYQHREHHPTD